MSSQLAPKGDAVFCRECGKPIEADARFCRFCGKPQADRPGVPAAATASNSPAGSSRPASRAADGLERWLRQLFPRHHLQDEFMHIGTIAAFLMALIGFVLGFFTPALGENWLSTNFLLAAIALFLFLILRESTLSHIRTRGGTDAGATSSTGRYHAARRSPTSGDLPTEAATTQSSPPPSGRPHTQSPPPPGPPPTR